MIPSWVIADALLVMGVGLLVIGESIAERGVRAWRRASRQVAEARENYEFEVLPRLEVMREAARLRMIEGAQVIALGVLAVGVAVWTAP